MALATDATTDTSGVEVVAPNVKRFSISAQIASADKTILEGAPNASGIITLPTAIDLAGIPGGPWLLTISKEVPVNA